MSQLGEVGTVTYIYNLKCTLIKPFTVYYNSIIFHLILTFYRDESNGDNKLALSPLV